MLRHQWERLRNRAVWSWAGLVHVWKTEASLHQWVWAFAATIVLMVLLPLSAAERGFLLMGGFIVLAMECLNTAVERVVDDISDEWRDKARQAKDAGSAAVALCGVGVGLAWVCVIIGLIW